MPDTIKIEKVSGPRPLAVVRFDRGDGINALSPEAMRQLIGRGPQFRGRRRYLRRGADRQREGVFRGFDLKDPEGRARKDMDLGEPAPVPEGRAAADAAWQEIEQITIGAIEGFASAAASRWPWRWISASWRAMPICACPRSGSA